MLAARRRTLRNAFIGSVRAAAQPGGRLPKHATNRIRTGAATKLGAPHRLPQKACSKALTMMAISAVCRDGFSGS